MAKRKADSPSSSPPTAAAAAPSRPSRPPSRSPSRSSSRSAAAVSASRSPSSSSGLSKAAARRARRARRAASASPSSASAAASARRDRSNSNTSSSTSNSNGGRRGRSPAPAAAARANGGGSAQLNKRSSSSRSSSKSGGVKAPPSRRASKDAGRRPPRPRSLRTDSPATAARNARARARKRGASDPESGAGSEPELIKEGERIEPDYASDSSDEETINVIGNVPLAWYDDHDHIGYDIRGNKIMRPVAGDMLDSFLEQLDSPDAWRTIVNAVEGKKIVLSDEDLDIIKRIQAHRFPQASYNEHEPTVEWFTSKTEIFPLSGAPEPKSRFIPSKVEAAKIIKIARKIQKGYIKLGQKKSDAQMAEETITDVWENEGTAIDHPMHVPAPKMRLPEHRESYNPPVEYIPTPQEKEELRKLDPRDRPAFLPKKYDTFRSIPMYDRLLQERFARCLDLYMCPRSIKQRVRMDPEDLLPKLPSRKDLEPYPTKLSIVFRGHTNRIRALSVDPTGKWIVSGSDDNTVRCWEIATGRCSKVWKFDSKVVSVAWNPNSQVSLVAVVSDTTIHLVYPEVGSDAAEAATEAIFKAPAAVSSSSEWRVQNGGDTACQIEVGQVVSKVSWHRRGDYFLSISSDSSSKSSVQIHQLSKRSSQRPFSKPIGLVQSALFHPSKPNLFVATQQGVRVYDLVQQKLVSKLQPGVQWISSMDIHPQGDNLIIGSYDKKVCWFDLDLSLRPYKTLRYHKSAVRNVSFHRKYPLFASCSDDGSVNVFHGMVYSSLDQNPLIVPLKSIKAHDVSEHLGVLFCEFHPTQPWLFSAGLSGEHHDVHLYV